MDEKKEVEIKKDEGLKEERKIDPKVWYISLLLILLFVLFVFPFANILTEKDEEEEKAIEETEEVSEVILEDSMPMGEIYLTLAPEGGNVNVYSLNLETMEMSEYFEESNYDRFMGKFSSDLTKMVFVKTSEDGLSQVVFFDETEDEFYEVTGESELFPRNPSFSLEGDKVVYWVYENTEEPLGFGESPEEHSIFLSSLETGEVEKVAQGAYPVFYPDENSLKIAFLKNDGLYSLDLDTGEETFLVWWDSVYIDEWYSENPNVSPGDFPNWLFLRFAFCFDSGVLLFTDVFSGSVSFFEMSELTWEETGEVEVWGPIWPVISPSLGNYYAVQEAKEVEGEDEGVRQLGVYEMFTSERILSFNLEDFEEQKIWLTDWIIR